MKKSTKRLAIGSIAALGAGFLTLTVGASMASASSDSSLELPVFGTDLTVTLDEEKAASVLKLLDVLEDNDDVQNVYANFDIPDAVMAKLSA